MQTQPTQKFFAANYRSQPDKGGICGRLLVMAPVETFDRGVDSEAHGTLGASGWQWRWIIPTVVRWWWTLAISN